MGVVDLDLRPGGRFHYSMKTPDGQEMWGLFRYQDIVKPEKIVFVSSFSNKDGEVIRHPLSTSFPLEIRNTLRLTENNGKTTLTLTGGPINATEEEYNFFISMKDNVKKGMGGTLDQLEEHLAKVQQS
jgi:uncharacterized protein YndB with AHSA1/START domain